MVDTSPSRRRPCTVQEGSPKAFKISVIICSSTVDSFIQLTVHKIKHEELYMSNEWPLTDDILEHPHRNVSNNYMQPPNVDNL